jgi:hypothetical protein
LDNAPASNFKKGNIYADLQHDDSFGSVSRKQLENNKKKINHSKPIRRIIIKDSYNSATIKIINY